ncbi:acyl-CoA thioesterase domain-containing protein [Acrocarpospora macrocephala]|nr:acyl-CoA thioesterase domain-containing protein [Acrocarpospora macrocephala]
MWFHRPVRADEWLLYELTSPVYQEALTLSAGRFFDLDGTLWRPLSRRAYFGGETVSVCRSNQSCSCRP